MRRPTVLVALVLASVELASPATAAEPDPVYTVTQPVDLLEYYLSPSNPEAIMWPENPEEANRNFMPDWNNNGVFGEGADVQIDQSDVEGTAPFRYPCLDIDGSVTYETVSGECVAADTPDVEFKLGQARRLHLIDAAGYRLSATLFAPHTALPEDATPAAAKKGDMGRAPKQSKEKTAVQKHSGIVFANGGWSASRMYYMYSMAAARAGYIMLNFDFEGTGGSEGDAGEDFAAPSGPCRLERRCRQVEDVVRWFVDAPVAELPNAAGSHDPTYETTGGDNPHNPLLPVLGTTKVAIMGQSGGSHAILGYPYHQAAGIGYDGNPLPTVSAAVALSGFPGTKASMPIQAQTADLDLPSFNGDNWGFGHTNGPVGTKDWYDRLRQSGEGNHTLDLIVIESGSHGDTTNLASLPRVAWSQYLTTYYAFNFLDCHVKGDQDACVRSTTAQPHLSRSVASEHDPDGPAGPSLSRCITVPDKATLGQFTDPAALLSGLAGQPTYDCDDSHLK